MHLKPILSLAALAGASADDATRDALDEIERSLQIGVPGGTGGLLDSLPPSAMCLIANQDDPAAAAALCCPCADPNDSICSILWCANLESGLSLKDNCECGQVANACTELAPLLMFATSIIEGLPEVCEEVRSCCPEPGGATPDEFNDCMHLAMDEGRIVSPDLSLLGGVPVFEGDGACEGEVAATEATTTEATTTEAATEVTATSGTEVEATAAIEAATEAATEATTTEATTTEAAMEVTATSANEVDATAATEAATEAASEAATEAAIEATTEVAATAPVEAASRDAEATASATEATTTEATTTEATTTKATTTEAAPVDLEFVVRPGGTGGLLDSLPPSALCLVANQADPAAAAALCCPCADPNDSICSILWCANLEPDNLSLKDSCECGQLADACTELAPLLLFAAGMVEGLPEVCDEVRSCCPAGGGTTADGFNACMYDAVDEGRIISPDLSLLGGVPAFEGDGACGEETTTEATTTEATTTEVTTTEATTTKAAAPAVPPGGGGGLMDALPPSALCLMANQADPAAAAALCCPCADPNDAICSILWCTNLEPDNLSLKEDGNCGCGQVRDACRDLGPLLMFAAGMVEGLPEVCDEVQSCCPEGGGTTADEFNDCMYDALDAGRIVAPDLSLLGGVPTFEGDGACEEEATDVEFIEAPKESRDDASTTTPPARSSKSSKGEAAKTTAAPVATIEAQTGATDPPGAEFIEAQSESTESSNDRNDALAAFLPPTATCLLAERDGPGRGVAKCCPCADPDDGICSILWCMNLDPDDLSLKDNGNCVCGQIRDGCAQLAPFLGLAAGLVEGLPEICAQADACCPEGATADAFNTCMYDALDAGTISAPDLSILGDISELEGDGACEEEGAATATEAPAEGGGGDDGEPRSDASRDDGATEATADTDATEATADTDATEAPAEGGDGDGTDGEPEEDVANWEMNALKGSDASKYGIGALVPLAGSLLAILMA